MATDTLTTKLSRRNMLSGMSAISLSAATLPALAIPSDPDGPDAELLRRIGLAERRREEFNATRLEHLRARGAMVRHPDYPADLMTTPIDDALCAEWKSVV